MGKKLARLRRDIDSRRKEIKKAYLAPSQDFEDQVKELLAMVDAPLEGIKAFVSQMEDREKVAKRREIPAGAAQKLSVDLPAAGEAGKNKKPPRFFVTQEKNAAPRAFFEGANLFKFQRDDAGEPSINKRPSPEKSHMQPAYGFFLLERYDYIVYRDLEGK